MSTERDELAKAIESGYGDDPTDCPYDHAPAIADLILAAGYRKPRQVTTVEELNALPVGTVLLLSGEGDVIRRHERRWYATGEQWSTFSNEIALPATVLFEGSL